ncbi:MAG: phage holin family protein [Pseudomonadota bacterium]|nr:phage holin family protein [Pseudomonadota bacterium]
MSALISRLISDATAPVEQMSARLFKKAVLFLVAIGCLFVCSIFLTIALFIFVQPLVGTVIAALGTGSLYLGVAGICFVVASRDRADQATPAAVESDPMTETKVNSSPQKLAFASNNNEAVAPILDFLREAGLERERLALEAGMEVAKRLHPFSLVALAIASGVVFGWILKQRRRPLI